MKDLLKYIWAVIKFWTPPYTEYHDICVALGFMDDKS